MTNEIQTRTEGGALQAQPRSPCSDWATPDRIIPQLSRNFALVRPVTMSDDAAAEWIAVAAAEFDGYRTDQLAAALEAARRECTHHGQIVPFVFKYLEQFREWRNGGRNGQIPQRRPAPEQLPPPQVAGLIANAAKALSVQT